MYRIVYENNKGTSSSMTIRLSFTGILRIGETRQVVYPGCAIRFIQPVAGIALMTGQR
jgi:hypothetical protein